MRLTKLSPLLVSILVLMATMAIASPAGAATGVVGATRPWHYWISLVLTASVLGLFAMLALGYVVKVVCAKYGIRVGRRPAG